MANTRIPLSWLLLLAVLAVFGFFAYQIFSAAGAQEDAFPPYSPRDVAASAASAASAATEAAAPRLVMKDEPLVPGGGAGGGSVEESDAGSTAAPIVDRTPPRPMPRVPAQTEEDLRASEPLQATPPAQYYNPPEHTDPLNKTIHMSAEFGSNFRHPEQMIEAHPGVNTSDIVASGIGSEYSSPGGNQAAMYAPEMAQNGGEFMRGIGAWDASEGGVAYSLI